MKKLSFLYGIAVMILTGFFVTSAAAAPKESTPPAEWDALLHNVEVIVENTDDVEIDISSLQDAVDGLTTDVANVQSGVGGVQTSVDGVQGGVNGLTSDVANVQTSVDGVQGGVNGLTSDMANVQTSVDGVQGSVDDLADSISALESMIADFADVGLLTEHMNGAETVNTPGSANILERWVIGDYADPRHVSLTLQARGLDNTDYVSIWVRTHPSDPTDSDKNIRYVYDLADFSGPSWVQQIEFDAIEWAIQVHKNDQFEPDPPSSPATNLTWAATVSALDYQNGAQTLISPGLGSSSFDRWVIGDYADPRHVSLTLQARGLDNTDYVSIWVRAHPSDPTDSDKNIRYVYDLADFSGPSWVQQIEFDAIEWAIQVHKNDQFEPDPPSTPSPAVNITWASTTE